jgi:tRNA U34 2-thiouridine synthase MnmA/TrmU
MTKKTSEERRALALISGGLDSQLAAKLVSNQGVEVVGVNYRTGFTTEENQGQFDSIERDLGIEIRRPRVDEEDYLDLIKSPEHGYGSAMNPCIDCRALVFQEAKSYMEEISADFVVTGEVLGQRPMTQRHEPMETLKKNSGLGDRLLRPLSAKLLPPTLPEEKGWVNREELLDIEGRSRTVQLELAEEFGIEHYSQPAGGCLLTEKEFGHRLQELFAMKGRKEVTVDDVKLLRHGRHFRLADDAKAIIGRNKEENHHLSEFESDFWRLRVSEFPGPLTLVTKNATDEELAVAARLTARYSQGRNESQLEAVAKKDGQTKLFQVSPLDTNSDRIGELRIESTS